MLGYMAIYCSIAWSGWFTWSFSTVICTKHLSVVWRVYYARKYLTGNIFVIIQCAIYIAEYMWHNQYLYTISNCQVFQIIYCHQYLLQNHYMINALRGFSLRQLILFIVYVVLILYYRWWVWIQCLDSTRSIPYMCIILPFMNLAFVLWLAINRYVRIAIYTYIHTYIIYIYIYTCIK